MYLLYLIHINKNLFLLVLIKINRKNSYKMNEINKNYCNSFTKYSPLHTREVMIGNIPLGGTNSIRVQSMTTTNTMDTKATVEQTIRMVNVGCEYVRITAPSIKEAKNLKNIKSELKKRGYDVPIIADIHFTPNAAEEAAKIVEKVRINPGNYIDKKNFQKIEYTDFEYEEEIDKIRKRITPLVKISKEYGTAMRIGTNHGSLSDRIMSRFGDTPLGMVESAMEFLRICEDLDYHDIVLSMKSSSTQVMVQAYRLLVAKMFEENMNYPLHLGVTEAGDGEDGRIKSAVGIGTLLEDGLGDTIRVSLTEEPENEIPVAIALANRYGTRLNEKTIPEVDKLPYDPYSFSKIVKKETKDFGGKNTPRVIFNLKNQIIDYHILNELGYSYLADIDKWNIGDQAPDYLFSTGTDININLPEQLGIILNYTEWKSNSDNKNLFPLFSIKEFLEAEIKNEVLNFIEVRLDEILLPKFRDLLKEEHIVLVLTSEINGFVEQRRAFIELSNINNKFPVIIKRNYDINELNQLQLYAATDFGGLLIDGFGDGIWIELANSDSEIPPTTVNRIMFGILQAARVRISKTEYIACPSCGRTLFDLVETTNKIREKTAHLKGVKIGIMGCIVNGPGEMADADYGYVGSGPGKITLYKGKKIVRKNIPAKDAVEELIEIIKENGSWVEPSVEIQ